MSLIAKSAAVNDAARAQKLMALAAPDSGTSEPERISAALEAAKLIARSGLLVLAPEQVRPSAPQPELPPFFTPEFAAAAREVVDAFMRNSKKTRTGHRRSGMRATPTAPPPPDDWTETNIGGGYVCCLCRSPIPPGQAWYHPTRGLFRCYDITCS